MATTAGDGSIRDAKRALVRAAPPPGPHRRRERVRPRGPPPKPLIPQPLILNCELEIPAPTPVPPKPPKSTDWTPFLNPNVGKPSKAAGRLLVEGFAVLGLGSPHARFRARPSTISRQPQSASKPGNVARGLLVEGLNLLFTRPLSCPLQYTHHNRNPHLQGNLAHKKQFPPRTLQ